MVGRRQCKSHKRIHVGLVLLTHRRRSQLTMPVNASSRSRTGGLNHVRAHLSAACVISRFKELMALPMAHFGSGNAK